MTKTYDVAVIGLGAMGSATLWQLARRGLSVVGIDKHAPPHEFGSSHGQTRITRQAIGEGEAYVPLVLRSHEIWKEIEELTGKQVLVECGYLLVAAGGEAGTIHGKADFTQRTTDAARAFGIEHKILGASEISSRFPQFTGLRGDEKGYYEPNGGYIVPELCIETQLDLARAAGADIRLSEAVTAIVPAASCVTVQTGSSTVMAGRVVVCTGMHLPGMLSAALARHLTVYRQVLHWFPIVDPSLYREQATPVFIWIHGPKPEDQFYGFPPLVGAGEIKAAEESYAEIAAGDQFPREVVPGETAGMFERHVAGRLGGLVTRGARSAVCYYTSTSDGDFLIDTHPESERITLVSACSGHGFKHSAAVGEAVAQGLAGETPRASLAAFGLSRFKS